MTNNQY